jgi:NADPH-dependent F420 reductase
MVNHKPTLAIIGGTGDLGGGLALRWLKSGYQVIIGSRSAENASKAVSALAERKLPGLVRGLENSAAAAEGDVVVLTVPFANHRPMLETIRDGVQGKILVDVTVPLVPPKVSRVQLPETDSAAVAAQEFLGENVRVVSAFQNVAADHLAHLDHDIDCDVLVCGNDKEARESVLALVAGAGMRGWHGGPIENSVVAEALTSVLIFINRAYKIDGAGIRITGQPGNRPGSAH